MLPVGFEPTISADERPQNYALDRAATGTGTKYLYNFIFNIYRIEKISWTDRVKNEEVLHRVKRLRWSRGSVLAFGTRVRTRPKLSDF